MKTQSVLIFGFLFLVGVLLASSAGPLTSKYETIILEKSEKKANTSFDTMMRVLTHQRCVNCHPNDNVPKQGDDGHPHYFDIKRGMNIENSAATNCTTCHQSENNSYSGVPGAPEWALTMHHLTEHELVLWAWEPGIGANGIPREVPPVPKEEYIAAVKKWFEEGHIIPSK